MTVIGGNWLKQARMARVIPVFLYLWVWTILGVVADKCITCRRDTLEECTDGELAKEFEGQQQQCPDGFPYCEVTVQELLDRLDEDGKPHLRDVSRDCLKERRFRCTTAGEVRTCSATCQGDLCNDFQDVARRVDEFLEQEKEMEEAARQKWVIPVAVAVPLVVVLVAVAIGIARVLSN